MIKNINNKNMRGITMMEIFKNLSFFLQVRLYQVRSGHVESGQVKSGQLRSGQVM